jgi:hypothetical protein
MLAAGVAAYEEWDRYGPLRGDVPDCPELGFGKV